MGNFCNACEEYHQEEFQTIVHISKELFSQINQDLTLFGDIKTFMDQQIPSSFTNYQFYLKHPNTYFIGSLDEPANLSYGILYKPRQALIYGNFLNGMVHGQGVFKLLTEKLIFRGEFKEGKLMGKGELEDDSKRFKFKGQWKISKIPISGVLKLYQNNTIEQIEFLNFQIGNAQIYYRNGSIYTGFIDWKTLLPHGVGKLENSSLDCYEGEWVNGKFEGTGAYVWKTGERYSGNYFNGLRHGKGKFYFSSKVYYTGMWQKGKMEGVGKIISPKGELIQKGVYRNGLYNQEQTEILISGQLEKAPKYEVKSQLMDQGSVEDNLPKQDFRG